MISYIKKGWKGELTFSQIVFGKYSSSYILDGGPVYIGFYILLLAVLISTSFELSNIWVYPFLLYGIGFYIWLLKAFWGSANQCSNFYTKFLIRFLTILLPVFSILSFFVLLLYYLVTGIIDALS